MWSRSATRSLRGISRTGLCGSRTRAGGSPRVSMDVCAGDSRVAFPCPTSDTVRWGCNEQCNRKRETWKRILLHMDVSKPCVGGTQEPLLSCPADQFDFGCFIALCFGQFESVCGWKRRAWLHKRDTQQHSVTIRTAFVKVAGPLWRGCALISWMLTIVPTSRPGLLVHTRKHSQDSQGTQVADVYTPAAAVDFQQYSIFLAVLYFSINYLYIRCGGAGGAACSSHRLPYELRVCTALPTSLSNRTSDARDYPRLQLQVK